MYIKFIETQKNNYYIYFFWNIFYLKSIIISINYFGFCQIKIVTVLLFYPIYDDLRTQLFPLTLWILCKHVCGQNTKHVNDHLWNKNDQILSVLFVSPPFFSYHQVWNSDWKTNDKDDKQNYLAYHQVTPDLWPNAQDSPDNNENLLL